MFGTRSGGFYEVERLIVFNRGGIINEDFDYLTGDLAFNLVEEFHGFDDADHFTRAYFIAHLNN